MFELSLVRKYLWPQKKALSTSLISILSIFLITLVIWLVVVFLSVTTGIESNWLHKLTSIHAPVKIYPTEKYFSSYYYQIDKMAESSSFCSKTLGEKKRAEKTDPYDPTLDWELSSYFPVKELNETGKERDLVKELFASLEESQKTYQDARFQDYEASGALMKLALLENTSQKVSFLSQVIYLASLSEENPHLLELLQKPNVDDLNHLLGSLNLSAYSWHKEQPEKVLTSDLEKEKNFQSFFSYAAVEEVEAFFKEILPISLFEEKPFPAYLDPFSQKLYLQKNDPSWEKITVEKKGSFFYAKKKNQTFPPFITSLEPLTLQVKLAKLGNSFRNTSWEIASTDLPLKGTTFLKNIKITKASPITTFSKDPLLAPLWTYQVKEKFHLPKIQDAYGIVLPKSYRENGAKIGDSGYFSYLCRSSTSQQEMKLNFQVVGFYDPGVMPVGNRFVFVPFEVTRIINSDTSFPSHPDFPSNGVAVWLKDPKSAKNYQKKLVQLLEEKNLSPYFAVTTYEDYPFSKDLLKQFQSDKLLFMLIALIIMLVACSNIISLLILLVRDKKREIAILKALGASSKSILLIFGLAGVFMGLVSCLLGSMIAIFTLKHLDSLVGFLSAIQGHAAFQAAFFGDKLPNHLSLDSLKFIWIVTPLLSLLAGCIPAVQAFKINPSKTLKGNG